MKKLLPKQKQWVLATMDNKRLKVSKRSLLLQRSALFDNDPSKREYMVLTLDSSLNMHRYIDRRTKNKNINYFFDKNKK